MPAADDPLAMDAERMREIGHRTVDLLVERVRAGRPSVPRVSRAETERRLGGPAPEEPEPFEDVLARLDRDVIGLQARGDHPAFFAFVPGSPTWPGALADLVASALNLHAIDWTESPGATQAELTVVRWMCEWLGLPAGSAGGTLLSGGSAANMTAIACARETLVGGMRDDLVLYLGDQAHSSMARAARILGFEPHQVRVLPVDDRFQLRADALDAAIGSDLRAGRRPLLLAASGGSTNTGAVDPLPALAALARERDIWLHVDAAYGGGAVLSERGRGALGGIELADSVTIDPHKWLYQPYECGALLVRDVELLHRAFEIVPDYLRDVSSALEEPNMSDLGFQLTRSARALKMWVSIRTFGLASFRRAIDRSLDLAEAARERIARSPSLELAAPSSLGVVCVRRTDADEDPDRAGRQQAGLVHRLADRGIGFVSSTRLHGLFAIRLCILNHGSAWDDVERVIAFLEDEPLEADAVEGRDLETRRESSPGWLRRGRFSPDELTAFGLFEGLDPAQVDGLRRVAAERSVAPGERFVEQWSATRDLFVLLEGEAVVTADGRHVARVGPGDHVGEVAAVDWGAGYGYARTATVTATTAVRLLVIPADALSDLVREIPILGERIRRAAESRLRDR